jgi:two-component system, NtrC family, sensor kinase
VKLLPKFALLSIGVAAVPLAIAGYSSSRISRDALRDTLVENELMIARQVSEFVASHLTNLHRTLAVETRVLDLTHFGTRAPSEEALRKFLQLVYHQSDDFSAVAVLDPEGQMVAPAAFQEQPRASASFGNHEAMRRQDVALIPRLTPFGDVLHDGSGVGPIFLAGPAQRPHILLAVKYYAVAEEDPNIIAAIISLRRISDYLATVATADRDILLLDQESRVVASGRDIGPTRLQLKLLPGTRPGILPPREFLEEYSSGGRQVVGAYSPASSFMLGVIVERRLEAAISPVRRLGWATLYWMSVTGLVAAVVGAALARTLSRRVGVLADGARQIAQGKLDTQLEVQSNDELGELAKGFNAMATSLDAARTEILRQTEEIMVWNEGLEKRVEEKTRELREAQELVLRSRSLAALGSLGAGVAHEINNPLTGVLGLAQLLLADLPAGHPMRPMVEDIEAQAVRIQGIVANLLRLTQKQSGEDFRALDLSRVLEDALELCGLKALADAGVKVARRVASPSPPLRGSAVQLQAALIELIQNARGAMVEGGQLLVETSLAEPGLLRLRIGDTGRGIKPEHLSRIFDPFFTTKVRRTDTGIGLSVVHKIIEDHGGTIRVESEPGQGTTFWITFPIAFEASHLP